MALEIKSVDGLVGTPISYAYAVRAGPWVFLTGHEAFDWRTGTIDASVNGPPGFPAYGTHHPSRREAVFVLRHLSRHDNFGDYIPPSTSVVMQRLFSASSTISTSLVAVMPEPGREIRKVYPPGVASAPTSGFVPAVVCDEFVFVAGQMAHNLGTGLDPRAAVPDHAAWAGIPIRRQAEFLIEHKLKPALETAGSALGQSIKAQPCGYRRHARLPRCVERALRRHSVRPDGGADQIVCDSGRHYRDQSDCARQRRDAHKRGD
jgi:hypothetical protein